MSLALVARGGGTWWTLVGNNFGKSQEAAQKQNAVALPRRQHTAHLICAIIAQNARLSRNIRMPTAPIWLCRYKLDNDSHKR
jgi:hypothetical protein